MKLISKSVYLGPNQYALFPVIRLTVDLLDLEKWPTGRLGGTFNDALLESLPGLTEHGCSYGVPGGFVRRLTEGEGTWLGHVLEHVAIELQNVAGADVTFGKTRSNGVPGQYDVVYEYIQEEVGLEAGKLAMLLLHSLLRHLPAVPAAELQPERFHAEQFDFEAERDAFIRFVQRRAFGPSTAALIRAAEERDIPWIRLNRYSLVQFGHGRYQKRILATVTSQTRHIGVEVASDKEDTNKLLGDLGLPVPKQKIVHSESESVRAAQRIGFPVVVKPLNANHGRGVSIDLTTADDVGVAFTHAREHSRTVLVERCIKGLDHRLLVIDGHLVAAAKRVPGHVVGDGTTTIARLVDKVNEDPRRGIGHEKVLTRLELDYQALRLLSQKHYDQDTVPPAGEVVYLRSTGNLSTGGTAVDVTDSLHPDNRQMAERAALAIGLDVAGVDFLTTDCSRSYKEIGGAICEVNAAPGFRMHLVPSEGKPRDVAGPVMDMLFPQGTLARVPIAAITGTNGKTTTTRMLAHIAKLAGYHVGAATTDGIYVDGHRTVEGDMTGPMAARMVLRDPAIDIALLETARGGLLKRGMGYRRCNVAACLNVTADHLGLRGINTVEELARVKRTVVEIATDTAVLNADDTLCLKMADYTQADHLCYVTMNPAHSLVRDHIRCDGRAVVLEEGMNGHMITIYDKGSHMPLLWIHQIPATIDGRAIHNVQNAMFAAALAYSLNIKLEEIRHGLRTFDTTYFQAPGRTNFFNEHPFQVILDYGHNPAAVRAMCRLVEQLQPKGRRIVVLAMPGDRRDEDIRGTAQAAAGCFDRYICRRDDRLRGRDPGEVPHLLKESLLSHGVQADQVEIIEDEREAVEAALGMAKPHDLLLIFGDQIDRCWRQIKDFQPDGTPPATEAHSPLKIEQETLSAPNLEAMEGHTLIRDERGVRLAKEPED